MPAIKRTSHQKTAHMYKRPISTFTSQLVLASLLIVVFQCASDFPLDLSEAVLHVSRPLPFFLVLLLEIGDHPLLLANSALVLHDLLPLLLLDEVEMFDAFFERLGDLDRHAVVLFSRDIAAVGARSCEDVVAVSKTDGILARSVGS